MNEPEMTNNELKIWLAGEFRALRTEMNGEIKLVREEIKTLQTEVRGEIGRIDPRVDGQNTLVTGLLYPLYIAIAIPLTFYLVRKVWNGTKPKSGDVIENDENQPELGFGNRPKHQPQQKTAEHSSLR